MLSQYIKEGLYIDGLLDLIKAHHSVDSGETRQIAITASYHFEKKLVAANRLTFTAFTKAPSIKLLPWLTGGISQVPFGGSEVLSGPFSGCTFAILEKDGTKFAAHVHRTTDGPGEVVKTTWEKGDSKYVKVAHETKGELSNWLVPKIENKKYKTSEMNDFGLFVIASPATDTFKQFLVHNKTKGQCKVVKVY